MTGRLCVILPTYNRADLIAETLDSLLVQSRPIDQLLVVDDGSTDGTGEIVGEYGDRVQYVHRENGGKASALNYGLGEVSGDYVWVCDDDDLIDRDAAERLCAELDRDPGLGYCAGRHEDFTVDPETGEHDIKPPGYWRASEPDELFSDLLDGCHIFQPGLIVRKSVYDQVGPFDPKLTRSQDFEMMLRVARASRGKLLHERVFLHREHLGDRGSAKERFSAEKMKAKWIKFHRMIMEPLMADLSDEELLPARVWGDREHVAIRGRIARVKRASVFARHMMWPEAAASFHRLAEQAELPFSDYEERLIGQATLSSFGATPLYHDDEVRRAFRSLKSVSPSGRRILELLAKSLHWRAKDAVKAGAWQDATRIASFAVAARL
ncbi:MAG: glycosyltransferase [Pseudomonadota bacterium]